MTFRILTLVVFFGVFVYSTACGQTASGGQIAYVRGSTEIRLIDPTGSNDRRLWTHPDLNEDLGIFELAWKPGGGELAFSSAHEATSSLYLADIYTIHSDGSSLQRLTNPPQRSGFTKFPKGSVTVKITNYQDAAEGSVTFIVYVAGADEPQQIFLPPGTSKTLTFKSVADFGARAQPIVAMFGKYRWFTLGVDVRAGGTVSAPTFTLTGKGYDMFGAFRPVWRSDGSRVSFRDGLCIVSNVPSTPTPGEYSFNQLFGGKNPMGTCTWDWGPTPATANQVIYSENSAGSNIYQMTEGGTHPGTKLTQFSDIDYQLLYDLKWMPDATGLLYSTVNLFRDSANIYRYDFASKRTTQITKLDKEFAREFTVSPDGRYLAFERCPKADDEKGCDIWIIGTDGSKPHLLARNGNRPAWSK
jgi:TolB protein